MCSDTIPDVLLLILIDALGSPHWFGGYSRLVPVLFFPILSGRSRKGAVESVPFLLGPDSVQFPRFGIPVVQGFHDDVILSPWELCLADIPVPRV